MSTSTPTRAAALAVIIGMLLWGCGSSDSTVGAAPTSTRRRATPTPMPTSGSSEPTDTPTLGPGTPTLGPAGTRTATPMGQRTRTRTATPGPQTTRSRTAGPVGPETLFVRANGNDENPGTAPDAALRTVTRAAQLTGPGTTVHVGPGEYLGRIVINNVAGTAANPVQLLADPTGRMTGDAPGAVTLDADGATDVLVITRSPFVTVDGFVMRGAAPQTMPDRVAASGIGIRAGSNNAEIRNCVIIDDGAADGILINGSSDVLVFNNLLFQNDRGVIILGASEGTRVINNTIVTHQRSGVAVAQRGGSAPADTTVVNNIIQENENDIAISVDQGPPTSQVGYVGDFNLAFEPDIADQGRIYRPERNKGENDVNADAMFVSIEEGDLHLDPDSPAINAGTDEIDGALVGALHERSTVADGTPDEGALDLGYHYPR